jgi:hypothetical protein
MGSRLRSLGPVRSVCVSVRREEDTDRLLSMASLHGAKSSPVIFTLSVAVTVVRQTVAVVDTKMTKSSGEHWVCSMLSQFGWGAALTRDRLERTDILAVHSTEQGRPMIEVQVKSLNYAGPKSSWPLGTKEQAPSQSGREWLY